MNHTLIAKCLLATLVCAVSLPAIVQKGRPRMEEMKDLDQADLAKFKQPLSSAELLTAAVQLQKMGKEKACNWLTSLARHLRKSSDDDAERNIIILCRMLFVGKPGANFREPALGQAVCLGDSSCEDWPLLPIEIVDQVPFVVVPTYFLAGSAESSAHYLDYCLKNCDWSDRRFALASEEMQQQALAKLLSSSKWKRPLTREERKLLSLGR